jgi:hypothetical protein
MMQRIVWYAVLLVGTACHTGTEAEPFSVSGDWQGATTYAAQPVQITLHLVDRSGTVQGAGLFTFPEAGFATSVDGVRDRMSLVLTLWIEEAYRVTFGGTIFADSLPGRLYGSGFHGEAVTFHRGGTP